MANWYGAARSNYVQIEDMEGLKEALEPFPITIVERKDEETGIEYIALLSDEPDSGGWPGTTYLDDDTEIEFSFEEHVMPYAKEGEVLVVMEAGAEKLRYITGWTAAYVRKSTGVEAVYINLDDIYEKAKEAFGVDRVTAAEY